MRLHRLGLAFTLVLCGCGNGSVASSGDAAKAYLGIDPSIDTAITLGFQGYNTSTNGANISPQTAMGKIAGTLTVDGMVDQGASNNKNMTLNMHYNAFSDDGKVTYDSPTAMPPVLTMSLKGIPTGTLTGSVVGALTMTGDLKNQVTLNLTFSGDLQAGANNTVERKPGTTHITGTATSDYGTYQVDVTR